jgi:uncharacterized LabA/DUF88 family protein
MDKIAIFVDVQNIYYTTRQAFGKPFNYRKFWEEASKEGDIVIANAYAIARLDDKQIKFQNALKHIGFEVKLKPFIQRQDGSAKGDWDVGITIDMMETASKVDKMILLSGDGDFDLLLKKLINEYKKTCDVYGVRELSADALINTATTFHPITPRLLMD